MIEIKEYYPFAIDNEGNVYNYYTKNKIKIHVDSSGYHRVSTKYKGKSFNASVHRLIAIAHIPNPDNKPEVNHINGIKTDNSISNLEWVTLQENSDHANSTGLRDSMLGEGSHLNVYPEVLIRSICEMLEQGSRNIDISRSLDVPVTLISDIRNKDTWTHVSDEYKIKRNKRKSYSEEKIRWVCNKIIEKMMYKDIAEQSGIPLHTVRDIRHGKSFRYISKDYF